jgi:hypothetical protein
MLIEFTRHDGTPILLNSLSIATVEPFTEKNLSYITIDRDVYVLNYDYLTLRTLLAYIRTISSFNDYGVLLADKAIEIIEEEKKKASKLDNPAVDPTDPFLN